MPLTETVARLRLTLHDLFPKLQLIPRRCFRKGATYARCISQVCEATVAASFAVRRLGDAKVWLFLLFLVAFCSSVREEESRLWRRDIITEEQ